MKLCPCGSSLPRRDLVDARGIFCAFVCDFCEPHKRACYRPEIFTDPNYWTDEPIETGGLPMSEKTIAIILIGPGGELDRKKIIVNDDDDMSETSVAICNAIEEAMEEWVLSPGDTIKIEEISEQ